MWVVYRAINPYIFFSLLHRLTFYVFTVFLSQIPPFLFSFYLSSFLNLLSFFTSFFLIHYKGWICRVLSSFSCSYLIAFSFSTRPCGYLILAEFDVKKGSEIECKIFLMWSQNARHSNREAVGLMKENSICFALWKRLSINSWDKTVSVAFALLRKGPPFVRFCYVTDISWRDKLSQDSEFGRRKRSENCPGIW